MANTARSVLRTRVSQHVQGRTDDTFVAIANGALDDACKQISRAWAWRELQTRDASKNLTVNVATLAVPADCDEILNVQIDNGTSSYKLEYRSKAWVEECFPTADSFGASAPLYYYREVDTLYVAPKPDASYDLRISYRAKLTLGSADAALISTDGFDDLVVALATALTFGGLERLESSAYWHGIYASQRTAKISSQATSGVKNKVDTRLEESNPLSSEALPNVLVWR